jgi:hypothetical protein
VFKLLTPILAGGGRDEVSGNSVEMDLSIAYKLTGLDKYYIH